MTHRKSFDEYIYDHWTDLGALAEEGPHGWTADQYNRFYLDYTHEIWGKLYDEYNDGIRYNPAWALPGTVLAWIATLPAASDVEDCISFVKHVSRHAVMVRASELMSIDPE